jgi:rhodanese-related sulfurtransferase
MSFLNLFSKADSAYHTVDCETLKSVLAQGDRVILLDVRTEAEHRSGHIPGSKNYNVMGPSFTQQVEALDRKATYYVYCASGNRSKTACSLMARLGFEHVHNLRMGMMGWNGQVSRS